MRLLTVACASLNQTPLDWNGNEARLIKALNDARAQGARVLCLPELVLSGYGCEDAFFSPGVQRAALDLLERLLPFTRGLVVGFGLPLYIGVDCYNAVAVCSDGKLLGFVLKQYLAREGLYYEPRWFRAWPRGQKTELVVGGCAYPVGDLYFEIVNAAGQAFSLGFEICEDAWAPTRPGARLAARGVELILNPSASHFAFGRFDIRKRFVLEGSRAFGVGYLYANLLGNEAGRVIYDGSRLIASGGQLVAQGPRFGFEEVALSVASVDLDLSRVGRPRSADAETLEGKMSSVESAPHLIQASGEWSYSPRPQRGEKPQSWETGAALRFEEFTRAEALGLFDYLRKSRSCGYVVSLSGGADSCTIVCLVHYLCILACRSLGMEGVRERLAHIPGLDAVKSASALCSALLTTVYQSTKNSSQVTRRAALKVAQAVRSDHIEWDVDALVEQYSNLVAGALGKKWSWDRDDLALQNIQARVRAPGVWMIANVKRALLLATSNRSEAAVGYATMDGDTAGGLSPLAGIDKAFIRAWLRWVEKKGPEGLRALAAVRAVNVQAPTAELRPLEKKQTDESDLMPYEVLDLIERFMVEQGKSPQEILDLLLSEEGGRFSSQDLKRWIERFFKLFAINQWKRERYAPSFHLDGHSLDPRSWYRFPILSGGFVRELAALKIEGPEIAAKRSSHKKAKVARPKRKASAKRRA